MSDIKPYVYRCEHKITKQFYFGYRYANTVCASLDLGIHYFTSSTTVSSDFSKYNYEILAEYDSQLYAYEVEQRLIFESINDDLCLNKNCKMKNLMPLHPAAIKEYNKTPYKNSKSGDLARDIIKKSAGRRRSPKYTLNNCSNKQFTRTIKHYLNTLPYSGIITLRDGLYLAIKTDIKLLEYNVKYLRVVIKHISSIESYNVS